MDRGGARGGQGAGALEWCGAGRLALKAGGRAVWAFQDLAWGLRLGFSPCWSGGRASLSSVDWS